MAYDPRAMMQMGRMGIGMLAPQQPVFDPDPDRNRPRAAPQWWEQPLQPRRSQPADQDADPSQAPGATKRPPSMFEMLMGGTYGGAKGAAMSPMALPGGSSPWAFLGSMGLPGGAGWGGSKE